MRDRERTVMSAGPWVGEGRAVPVDGRTPSEAIAAVGADWLVEKRPMHFDAVTGVNSDGTPHVVRVDVPKHNAVVRADTDECIGVTGNRVHTVLQNTDHGRFADEVGLPVDLVGTWKDGAGLFVQQRFGRDLAIGSDRLRPYVLSTNVHNGTGGFTVSLLGHRPPCDNMFPMAHRDALVRWSFRHTAVIGDRVRSAAVTLKRAATYFEALEQRGRELLAVPMTGRDFERVLDRLVPMPEITVNSDGTTEPASARAVTMAEKRRDEVRGIYRSDMVGDDIRPTAWGVVQTFHTDYVWGREAKGRSQAARQIANVADGAAVDYVARVEAAVLAVAS
jgi:phage/plasmid-like protein (TIGR03299 family)